MKTSISIGSAYYNGQDWDELVDYCMAADRLGVDQAWSAEAWGMDTIVPLAFLAAKTENIKLGTGIMQISARVPSMTAMTSQSLDTVSKGRFILGLGVSGPQVVEGLHGASFAKPLSRLREYVEILKIALAGEKVQYDGEHYLLPRPGGEGRGRPSPSADGSSRQRTSRSSADGSPSRRRRRRPPGGRSTPTTWPCPG